MFVAIVLVLLVVGSVIFHFASPWWFTPLASNWGAIDFTINVTFWVTGFVFVAVNLFMAYALIKYRHRPDDNQPAHYEPENSKLEMWLTVLTAVGVAAMLAPGLFVWGQFVTVPEEAWEVEAVGEQWRWTFRLPGKDGKLGTSDVTLVNINNPFGVNPDDPTGADDILVTDNQVHIPIDKPVKFLLRSKDVLHDFAVAEFRVKMDLVPGLVSYLWLTPTRTGTFEILCEELCGIAHFTMRGKVIVDEQKDFDNWLGKQITFKESQAIGEGDAIAGRSSYIICSTCHGPQGEGNIALNSPKLAGKSPWYLRKQIANFKHGIRGAHKDDTYGQQMAPMAATLLDETAIRNVAAYITTLPESPAESSDMDKGVDIEHGQQLYRTCGTCHGANGQGNYAMNSPRLSGQESWYMIRQLQNFKTGVRGAHPDDTFGPQMISMSRFLRSEDSVKDVVAYIGTLSDQGGMVAKNTQQIEKTVPEEPIAEESMAEQPIVEEPSQEVTIQEEIDITVAGAN
ncbi:MAG TPA: c-type cytochrome [Gammaproteobacteria bacterium]|nr:c-type cytochrome [Gammaproteobacteria bacterium]HIL96692.1 c-type cytochrome [Pseudomonadales bacterium]